MESKGAGASLPSASPSGGEGSVVPHAVRAAPLSTSTSAPPRKKFVINLGKTLAGVGEGAAAGSPASRPVPNALDVDGDVSGDANAGVEDGEDGADDFSKKRKKRYGSGGGKWTAAEDNCLRAGVAEIGPRNWKAISFTYLKGKRSDVQCLHRWQKVRLCWLRVMVAPASLRLRR
jgi:hypothetical protein